MDAQTLFRDGVMAVREGKDLNRARQLLLQSLKLNPQNEVAWLWLSQTVVEPQKKLECINRALKINPDNAKALELRLKLTKALSGSAVANKPPTPPVPVPKPAPPVSSVPVQKSTPPSLNYIFDDDESDYESTPAAAFVDAPSAFLYGNPTARKQAELVKDEGLRAAPTIRTPLSPDDERDIKSLLEKADAYIKTGKSEEVENAIEQWVRVLEIRVDHELAIQNSVRYLARLGFMDDAKELIWRAIDAGTLLPSIYVTAVDIAQRMHDHSAAAEMTKRLLPMPEIDEALILKITDQMVKYGQTEQVIDVLEKAIVHRPKSQKFMIRIGELYDDLGKKEKAVRYFDRAARIKSGTKEAKRADKALMQFTPIITDRERGNVWLAVREAAGILFFYLLLGWQDAGMNLFNMGLRWLGVLLSFVGGYFVITAVSSPQQQPLATWLGGKIPPAKPQKRLTDPYGNPVDGVSGALEDPTELTILPQAIRVLFFILGAALLLFSFYLVFSTAIRLLFSPVPPTYIPNIEELLSEAVR